MKLCNRINTADFLLCILAAYSMPMLSSCLFNAYPSNFHDKLTIGSLYAAFFVLYWIPTVEMKFQTSEQSGSAEDF